MEQRPKPGVDDAPVARVASGNGLEPLPRARVWLVDGYNVLHCAPFRYDERANNASPSGGQHDSINPVAPEPRKPFWSSSMRERLVAFARRFPDPHAEIWLVFDGARAPEDTHRGDHPHITLQFAPSADDWIARRVRHAEEPNQIAVVSGDRRLTGRTRHHGAAVVSPRKFLQHCDARATDPTDHA